MKVLAILSVCLFSAVASAQTVLKKLDYDVTASNCMVNVSTTEPCAYEYSTLSLSVFDDGTAMIENDGATGGQYIFMGTDSNDGGFEALNVSPDYRRVNYSNTKELFSTPDPSSPNYVIDRISVNIQFNQINADTATYIETTTIVNADAQISVITFTVNLTKKTN